MYVDNIGRFTRVPNILFGNQGVHLQGCSYTIQPGTVNSDNDILTFYPEFEIPIKLAVIYYGRDTVLRDETDIENKWLRHASRYIIGLAGGKIAVGLQDIRAIDQFTDMQNLGRQAVLIRDTAYRSGAHKPQFGAEQDRNNLSDVPFTYYPDTDFGV